MKRALAVSCMFLLLITPAVWGQTSEGNVTTLDDRQPAENVRGGAVYERAPGRIIDFARARHMALNEARLGAQRTGETAALAPEPGTIAGFASSSNPFLGLISSFLNSTGVGGAVSTGTGTSGGTGLGGLDLSNLDPEAIQMLEQFFGSNGLNQKTSQNSSTDPAAQPKDSQRAQTSDAQQERSFAVRWAEAMLSTVFTSLAGAVSPLNTDFVDLLKDLFRPLFGLEAPAADESDGATSRRQEPAESYRDLRTPVCRSWIQSTTRSC